MTKLQRTAFESSRAGEYFDARQLSAPTGSRPAGPRLAARMKWPGTTRRRPERAGRSSAGRVAAKPRPPSCGRTSRSRRRTAYLPGHLPGHRGEAGS